MKASDLTREIAKQLGIEHVELDRGAQLELALDVLIDNARALAQVDSDRTVLEVFTPARVDELAKPSRCTECGRWNYHTANCTRRPMP